MGSSGRAGMTTLGIIVVTGLNSSVNLKEQVPGLEVLRGLVANVAVSL